MSPSLDFTFGKASTRLFITEAVPDFSALSAVLGLAGESGVLLVCDTHTSNIARRISAGTELPLCVLEPGESGKNWTGIERILESAAEAGLGRDGLFIGIGGGVICDMTAFAASIYMRGARLCLIPTTLLSMVDASLGGKTGIDLCGYKNFAGTFYPAELVYLPLEALASLPFREYLSGMAEIIKAAVLGDGDFFDAVESFAEEFPGEAQASGPASPPKNIPYERLAGLIEKSLLLKGRIVTADPEERTEERILLNLGHSFGHALESAAGLGVLTHGEAVAWGMVRSCELGQLLGITPPERARRITKLISSFSYEVASPHPSVYDTILLMNALRGDKKKKAGKSIFIVPAGHGAVTVSSDDVSAEIIYRILNGDRECKKIL